jgi:flagellar basal-body rod protein FlgB
MSYSIDGLAQTGRLLDIIAAKQNAIGDNLANIDTPGYVRKDVDFGKYIGEMGGPLETKLTEKLGASVITTQTEAQEIDPAQELMQLQKNAILYTMATRRMSNIITEMKTVISVGK